ncbi:N-acetylmuramoyl-L-alanine amidase [Oscillatoria sp. FACHB-1406]|uniref:hormogonium tapered terminus morphoprotein TftA n=1 Tax=Oscillatoria sp. FACHB-1406 TaxID=2692846 RepID=UPI00168A2FDE|nr:N-acetylmuramoyl-L-alanine amidase [Oscillatoria sp. FACHB-1406]MBD2579465.1 N-acetylmuramoyl-L-alanine amidase [Oscillatoria sp. FACHB-1406]
MGRIFISAGHGGYEGGRRDPGAIAGGTTEAQQMILLRDQIVPELRSRGYEVFSVPDTLSIQQTLDWINARDRAGDIAIEIHSDAYSDPNTRGATAFHIAGNDQRKRHAETLLLNLLRRLPQLPSRGAKPDTATGVGRLSFCREVAVPSLLLEVGFITNPDDRFLLTNRRKDMAAGIADGLVAWAREIAGLGQLETAYPAINIRLNNQNYSEQGILVNGNAYIPIDLVDRLGIDLTKNLNIRLLQYRGIVYVKAVDLRDYNVSVGWDNATRSVVLRSIGSVIPGVIDRIISPGQTSEVQLQMFLKNNNENAFATFPEIAKLYREEATAEGVNYDIAFCQMCLETAYLRFGSTLKAEQNNFGNLGAVGGGTESASFPSARIGVRAQIQHLKAYASLEPLVQEVVDPRFRFVTRGIAPLVGQLSGRWSADLQYGDKIMAILRRLYESANLL